MQETAFGKYRLIASLGHGGMADVYLAVVTGPAGFSKLQVIKRMRQELTEDEDHLEMFLDEARLAARLNHANVVQTFEVGQEEGEYYLAMEYLEGAPLNRVLNRTRTNPAPPGVLLRVVADTLAGLHYAHELRDYDGTTLNIVHRDATPHNIFVTYDGQTKVVDFGIAKAATRSNETRAGVLKGKVGYMAPEQARCLPLDRRADIFALGIVLWEILAGRRMWDRQSDMEVLHRVASGNLPRLGEVCPDTPPELVRICERAMALEPENRHATAAEMRGELLAYMDRAGLKVTPEDVGQYVSRLFADKREEIRAVVERQLSKLSAQQDGALPELSSAPEPESTSLPKLESGSGRVRAGGTGKTARLSNASGSLNEASLRSVPPPMPMTQEATPAAPASNNRLVVAAFGAMTLFAALAAFFFLASRRGTNAEPAAGGSPAPAMTAVVAEQPTAAPAPPPAGSAAPAAKGEMIEIKVRAIPAHADVFLDGARLPQNPFTGRFPADGASHRVHAEAADHRTAGKIVTFDRDGSIDIVLESKNGSTASRADSAQRPADPSEPEPIAQDEPSASPALAGKPTATGKPKRQLDGATPWSSPTAPTATATGSKRKLDSNPW